MIILISDGYSWDLSNGRDEEIATRLRENGIEVFAIHVADGSPPDELVVITSRTGGALFSAGDPDTLESVFRRIDATGHRATGGRPRRLRRRGRYTGRLFAARRARAGLDGALQRLGAD